MAPLVGPSGVVEKAPGLSYDTGQSVAGIHTLYKPLPPNHTRVVKVDRDDSSNLEFRLLVCQLVSDTEDSLRRNRRSLIDGHQARYTALSYTWNDGLDKAPIKVLDDHGQSQEIAITRSLLVGIDHMCPSGSYIWADQISIDQSSNADKKSQIALMRDIYEHASMVCIWLGTSSRDSDVAMSKIRRIATAYTEYIRTVTSLPSYDALNSEMLDLALETTSASGTTQIEEWEAVARLMNRPWFFRAWIRQEATAISPEDTLAFCGRSKVTFNTLIYFSRALSVLTARPISTPAAHVSFLGKLVSGLQMYQMCNFLEERKISRKRVSLLRLVESIRNTQTTDG
jgi:Heterokaryon incompatibility protein (HET)